MLTIKVDSPTKCQRCHCESQESLRVCARCLGRHHVDCWRETEQCARCACAEYLQERRPSLRIVRLPAKPPRLWPWVILWTLFVIPTSLFAATMTFYLVFR